MIRPLTAAALLLILLNSCEEEPTPPSFETDGFDLFNNFEFLSDTLELKMDLSGSIFDAIHIPSNTGADQDSIFKFTFRARNLQNSPTKIGYKIYYQNISYAHPVAMENGSYNPESSENFYGSWISDSLISFKPIELLPGESKNVSDRFFISGNPLNDPRYFNPDPAETYINKADVEAQMTVIQNDENWMKAIAKKAEENNNSLQDQLRADALWTVQNNASGITKNRRWQRNPRVGLYEFILVVGNWENIQKLPASILDPLKVDEDYDVPLNPFFYFNHLPKRDMNQIQVIHGNRYFRTYAVLTPEHGLFYDPGNFKAELNADSSNCSKSEHAHKMAHFQQYVNTEVKDSSLYNINLTANVVESNMSNETFEELRTNTERIPGSYVESPLSPCINARYDAECNCIVVTNPGNEDPPYRKENAGVEGRIGFTYGKFTGKLKFPEVMSANNVWNGITCAYWLKFQSLKEWNMRNTCLDGGYLQSGYDSHDAVYTPANAYSEIDIEIVKTSKYWPATSEINRDPDPNYNPADDNNLIVSCTNWDLACQEPSDFGKGAYPFQDGKYYLHRWSDWYKALTLKTENPHNETVGSEMYYQIDWRPDEIIWRIGPDSAHLKEVGYMNSTVTKVPNNQMVPVMSQEFHYGHWWPTTPYPQGDIPYPKDPIKGYLYEVEVR